MEFLKFACEHIVEVVILSAVSIALIHEFGCMAAKIIKAKNNEKGGN